MTVFAFFVSLIFATIAKDAVAEQVKLGARMFATFLGAAIALGEALSRQGKPMTGRSSWR